MRYIWVELGCLTLCKLKKTALKRLRGCGCGSLQCTQAKTRHGTIPMLSLAGTSAGKGTSGCWGQRGLTGAWCCLQTTLIFPFALRHAATKGILVAMVCTFFEAFNVPVFWPILVMYFIMLFCITMKRQIKVKMAALLCKMAATSP